MLIDRISYQLSYTDGLPIISIPSAILHLICFVRDQIFGKPQVEPKSEKESLRELAERKLDDWSHLTKGILGLIPLLGNAILICEAIWRMSCANTIWTFQMASVDARRLVLPDDNDIFPAKLLNDAEFIRAAAPFHFHMITGLMSAERKNDKTLILDLIRSDNLNSYSHISPQLQMDEEVWQTYLTQNVNNFGKLPEGLKNDLRVIDAAVEKVKQSVSYDGILWGIPNRTVLKKAKDSPLLVLAVRRGVLDLNELDPKYRSDRRYAVAALSWDINQFDLLSSDLQRDITVHLEVIASKLYADQKAAYAKAIYDKTGILLHYESQGNSAPSDTAYRAVV